jgi:hypothetical protein
MAGQLIRLVEGTRQAGTCRACGAPLDWIDTLAGRRMPMRRGAVAVSPDTHDPRLALFAAADAHWMHCPEAERFRRRQKARE